jgi:hypothetical protein
LIDDGVASLPRSSGRAVIQRRAADRIGIAAHGVINEQQPGKVLRQGPSPDLDELEEASDGRSMQVLGPITTGPAWLLPMASTIPYLNRRGEPWLRGSSYSLLQRKWLRYWCARPRCGSRVIPSNVVTTGSSQRQPLVTCGRGIAEPYGESQPQTVYRIVKEEGAGVDDVMGIKTEMVQGHGEARAVVGRPDRSRCSRARLATTAKASTTQESSPLQSVDPA